MIGSIQNANLKNLNICMIEKNPKKQQTTLIFKSDFYREIHLPYKSILLLFTTDSLKIIVGWFGPKFIANIFLKCILCILKFLLVSFQKYIY